MTTIDGGTAGNIVPGSCRITLDRRVLPDENEQSVTAEIREVLGACGVAFDIETESWVGASLVAADHPMVQRLRAAILATGGSGKIAAFPATCEAPYFTQDKGIPALIFGPGSIAQAHVVDEFVRLDEVLAHCDALIRFLGEGS